MTLNDFFPTGDTEIWYAKDEFVHDSFLGYDWLKNHNLLPTSLEQLQANWVLLGTIKRTEREIIFEDFQSEFWPKPWEKVRDFIKSKDLSHTSMSVGDIIRVFGEYQMVDRFGFKKLDIR